MLLAVVLLSFLALPLVTRIIGGLVRREWEQIVEQRHPSAVAVPIERVAADLRRLRARLEARENQPGLAGKGMKMGALRVAYLQVLDVACAQLDIRPAQKLGRPEPPLAEIYRVEAELRARGLDVRTIRPSYPHQDAA
ncbi:MAG: hypothetical protein ABI140_00980 [Jatrophihabitantaceae bacterium]